MDIAEEIANRPRHVRHPCSGVRRWGGEPCGVAGAVERDGTWYCRHHDPDRHRHRCSATNTAGDQCGNRATIERDGVPYCYVHDPAGPEKHAEELAEERDRAEWAAATVEAAADGVKVFLIREDVLAAVRTLLAQLPYGLVREAMKAIDALPEAPLVGRKRILDEPLN
jgi:hypothetical protein